ncbi:unnamed protein product [Calypogeia fissa]
MTADAMYCCKKCGVGLNITSNDLYPPDTYFEAGNRGTLSFMEVDMSKFGKQKEKKGTLASLFLIHWIRGEFIGRQPSFGAFHVTCYWVSSTMTCPGEVGIPGFGHSQVVPRGEELAFENEGLARGPSFRNWLNG